MAARIPLVICGGSPKMATSMAALLKPEYEAIHIILSTQSGAAEIPVLLKGGKPNGSESNIGSKNYSKPPAAIVVGGVYSESDVSKMRDGCKGLTKIPWLRTDMSKPAPPYGPGFGEALVVRLKARLKELGAEEGKMNSDEVLFY